MPEGRYTDFETGKVLEGGRFYEEHDVSPFRIPILVRPGTLLVQGQNEEGPEYDFSSGLTLELFELADGAVARARCSTRTGRRAQRSGIAARQNAALPGHGRSRPARPCEGSRSGLPEGGKVIESNEQGTLISWDSVPRPLVLPVA